MKVAVVGGGRSYEREVSLRSMHRVTRTLATSGHSATSFELDPHTATTIARNNFDLAFVVVHGAGGSDGELQELLDLAGVSYCGSSPGALRLMVDKDRTKAVLHDQEIATPRWIALGASALREMGGAQLVDLVPAQLGLPVVVKPAAGGSAFGIQIVEQPEQLPAAVLRALSYGDRVIFEQFIAGRELSIGLLEVAGALTALPAVEIAPRNASFYDFASRYVPGEAEFVCPAPLSTDAAANLAGIALAAARTCGVRGYGRVDMMLDGDGSPWLLELEGVPGLTETSLLPLAAGAAGHTFAALCETIMCAALTAG